MTSLLYLDTSALAKWYLNEPGSERFRTFFREQTLPPAISTLTVLELRCLVGRRRRAGEIDGNQERLVLSALEKQIDFGLLDLRPLEDTHARAAIRLLDELRSYRLRTLDALHLAIARDLSAQGFATADYLLAEAAAALGFATELFV